MARQFFAKAKKDRSGERDTWRERLAGRQDGGCKQQGEGEADPAPGCDGKNENRDQDESTKRKVREAEVKKTREWTIASSDEATSVWEREERDCWTWRRRKRVGKGDEIRLRLSALLIGWRWAGAGSACGPDPCYITLYCVHRCGGIFMHEGYGVYV